MRETLPKAQAEVAEVRSTAARTYTPLYTASHPLHTLCTSASLHAAAPLHLAQPHGWSALPSTQAELATAHEAAAQAQARYVREKEAAEAEWKRAEALEAEL